jgi:hypothetical protein
MRTVDGPTLPTGQRLPIEWRRQYLRDEPYIIYTVLSYDTPIAWVLETGEVRIPPVKYSRTTSGHQSQLYALTQPVDSFSEAADREVRQVRERLAQRNETLYDRAERMGLSYPALDEILARAKIVTDRPDYAPVRMEYSESYSVRQGWAVSSVQQNASGVMY